jgi:DNA repair photolyase
MIEHTFDTADVPLLADLQRAPGTPSPGRLPTLPLDVAAVRTFDTPEFAGMTFLEVEAKSALNRVRGMPFPWSINPYRGCSHACSYCLLGETPVLMADGRTKELGDVRVGDQVYGTARVGSSRRYVVTRVLDHWSTLKPACEVMLEDGTRLVASADHRFLTNRGWKRVGGAGRGPDCGPHLTTSERLIGTGGFASPPKQTPEYRRGYLCGMIRGVGSLRRGPSRHFRLALVDVEGLRRTADFLLDHGIATRTLVFQQATATRKQVHAIEATGRERVAAIIGLVAWPADPCDDWCKGFLAGFYDAEGTYSRGILRIPDDQPQMRERIGSCLGRFGFSAVAEPKRNGCTVLRVPGGTREHLRFFHTVDPAVTRKRTIDGQALDSNAPLRVAAVEPLGFHLPMFDITTGTGDFIANGVVSHNCFARPSHAYLNLSPLGDFERTIVVKTNVVEVLRRELARPSWKGEHVAMGTNTDPYQRCEGRYRLMPGTVSALAEAATPFSILTKGTLITRDVDALAAAREQVEVTAALTVGMLDEALWRSAEPGTPSPRARLAAVRALNDRGVPTGVMLAPIMPGLNDDDEQLAALVEAAAGAGATHITPIVLHLRPGVRELFWPWLEESHPDLVARYRLLYRRSTAAKDYRERVEGFVAARRRAAWARRGGRPEPPAWGGRRPASEPQPAPAEQLRLL